MALGYLTGWNLSPLDEKQDSVEPHTTITTVPGDPLPNILFFPAPYPVYHDTGTPRLHELPVDTGPILADYFSRNVYLRVLKEGTSALVILTDTVTHNRLTTFGFEFKYRHPTAIITNTYTASPQHDFVLSAVISLAVVPERTCLMGSLQLTDRRQRSYHVMADPGLTGWQVGIGVPVRRWQRNLWQWV